MPVRIQLEVVVEEEYDAEALFNFLEGEAEDYAQNPQSSDCIHLMGWDSKFIRSE